MTKDKNFSFEDIKTSGRSDPCQTHPFAGIVYIIVWADADAEWRAFRMCELCANKAHYNARKVCIKK